jgi:hypothetical protein
VGDFFLVSGCCARRSSGDLSGAWHQNVLRLDPSMDRSGSNSERGTAITNWPREVNSDHPKQMRIGLRHRRTIALKTPIVRPEEAS